ncbi:MAG: hypothetical protein LUC98_14430 [Lachnospiraceae bacterium]|nr:hypothetical protein [Lachnospiraceae bacterium]
MGRGGAGGGGGRSSGGHSSGGGRSFGGRSSGGASRGGSMGSGSRNRGGGGFGAPGGGMGPGMGGMGGPRPPRPPRRSWFGGWGYGGYGRRGGGCGTSMLIVCILVVLVLFSAMRTATRGFSSSSSSSDITASTVEREKIQPYDSFDSDCIDDELDWILNKNTTLSGMESFYKETGVQPYLVITDNINGGRSATNDEIEAYCDDKYTELAGDNEAGVLLVFVEWSSNDYSIYYIVGTNAQTVMDSEACEILLDYVDAYYYSDLSDEEYFSQVFSKAAERIMSTTPTLASRLPYILAAVVVIVVAVLIFLNLRNKRRREKEKAEETERILNTPIDKL